MTGKELLEFNISYLNKELNRIMSEFSVSEAGDDYWE